MFTKEEKKALVQKFWSQFDDYCDTIPELGWRKKKWILYDTKISHVDLKFDLGLNYALVALEINHRSEDRRLKIYELVERYRLLLEQGFGDGLTWDFNYLNSTNQEVCRIYVEKKQVNFQKISDWPVIYDFLAQNMLQLQENFLEIQEVLIEEINILNREM